MAFYQCPTSKTPPPVPISMRSRYRPGELDEDGYRNLVKPGYAVVVPFEDAVIKTKCDYCGKFKCGCGASTT